VLSKRGNVSNMIFCYLILHYKNIDNTITCIESIINTASNQSFIVVVDNGSKDESGEKLKERYKKFPRVVLLTQHINTGFSKGNNFGYFYIKTNLKVDFIVCSNNDVVFTQSDFESKIEAIFQKEKFYVLGPDIFIPKNNEHQNPIFLKGITKEDLKIELEMYMYYQKHPRIFMQRLMLHELKGRLISCSKFFLHVNSRLRKKEEIDYRIQCENVGLQGACLIFSDLFISKESKLFVPEPFLYCEEEFLFYRCKQKVYKTLYSPELTVNHVEGASFLFARKKKLENLRFQLKYHVESRKLLLDYLEEKNDDFSCNDNI
jgi:GT2 family glycosyltransferase